MKLSDPHPLTLSVLVSEARIRYGVCGEGDARAALKTLEQNGLVIASEDPLTGDVHYGLTAKGRSI
ncbi:MAG: hypothetical protein LBK76_04550 [Verrucomicrobiales bacterium]|nr:hypothetical protein [Verrucomicrobiales bacterium]